jgi:hypothetical protein
MLCSLLRKTGTVSECVSPKSLQDCLVNATLRPINLKTSQHRGATVNPAPFSPVLRLCKYFMHKPPYLIFVNNSNLLVRLNAVRIAVPECLLCAGLRVHGRLLCYCEPTYRGRYGRFGVRMSVGESNFSLLQNVQSVFGVHSPPIQVSQDFIRDVMRSGRDIDNVQLTDFHVKCPLFLYDFNQNCIGWLDRAL